VVNWQVNYINAHATSTIVGDLAEVNALKKVFKDTSEIKMNATKVFVLSISSEVFLLGSYIRGYLGFEFSSRKNVEFLVEFRFINLVNRGWH
jgi:hypothetical protein